MEADSFGNLCYLLQCYDTNETHNSFALKTYDQSLVRAESDFNGNRTHLDFKF